MIMAWIRTPKNTPILPNPNLIMKSKLDSESNPENCVAHKAKHRAVTWKFEARLVTVTLFASQVRSWKNPLPANLQSKSMKRRRTAPNSESKRNAATPRAVSDALPVPPAETNTATTLATILHTLETMQATMSSMQTEVTDIKESQLSIISAQRDLSNQVLDLQKHKEKLFLSLQDLPLELIVQIFAWIPVRTVFKYRRLSRMINQCLLTSQFAVLNMRTSDFQKKSRFLRGSNHGIGWLWLLVPPSYQTVVARAMAPHAKGIGGYDFCPAHYKKVTMSLPNSISCLTAVEEIILETNTLIGKIPDVIGTLKNLTIVRLAGNSLTGALPSSLNLLSALQYLNLAENQLNGEFPPLPNLNSLESLKISRNCFTGPVPTVFGNSRKMALFHADHNHFSVIPASIGQLTNLVELSISGNRFSSEIPSELWNLGSLTFLEMSNCNMFGSLAGVGNLRNLEILDLANNRFSGEFPSREIYNLPLLEELHLVGNQFSGGKVLDMSLRDNKMTMCMDREFQRKYVIRQGFHKCHEQHGVVPFTGDISDSEVEDKPEIGRP
ncbi:hypothetical protein CcCBS67573_g09339 [Chytriomyces confervae]|uniref:F-box domain-containing protein n=1 Tax=Chytriomyces confervae TaxID=246404 RepID=A0A507DXN9_9FUNG|nr:hypothetical protein CcCBS67573_g09339 [Chytriomyces confervae]